MMKTSEEVKEKHINEIRSFVKEQERITDQLILISRKTRNTLHSIEKFIGSIKDEDNMSGVSVKTGEFCFELGLNEHAMRFFEKAIASDPRNSDAYNDMGVLYLHKGQISTAEGYFEKAIELDPDNEAALKNLSLLHENVHQDEGRKIGAPDERVELRDMKSYWDACAREDAMRHIACDDWQSEEIFNSCGEKDISNLLNNVDEDFLKGDNKRVLEIGCGIGRMLKPLAIRKPTWEIYGIDVSDEMVRKGRLRLRESENIKLLACSGKDLGIFDEKYFDLVYSYIVFQHIPRKFVYNYFKEINRVLVEDGLLVFQMPLFPENMSITEPPDTDFRTLRCYSIEEVHAMCRSNNLRIVKTAPIARHKNYSISSAWFTALKI